MTDQSTISQLNPILVLADADLLLADQSQGDGTYVTKKITAANVSAKFSAEAGAAASGYADDAATSAADADSSATSASTSAATATTKAGVATTKAGDAASSAAAAAISETNAATSETNAATSETNAAASKTAAAVSEANAAASAALATVTGANLFGRGPVISILGTPPGSPTDGDRYLVAHSGTTGAWVGKEDQVVERISGAWVYSGTPVNGQPVFVQGEGQKVYMDGWLATGILNAQWFLGSGGDMGAAVSDAMDYALANNGGRIVVPPGGPYAWANQVTKTIPGSFAGKIILDFSGADITAPTTGYALEITKTGPDPSYGYVTLHGIGGRFLGNATANGAIHLIDNTNTIWEDLEGYDFTYINTDPDGTMGCLIRVTTDAIQSELNSFIRPRGYNGAALMVFDVTAAAVTNDKDSILRQTVSEPFWSTGSGPSNGCWFFIGDDTDVGDSVFRDIKGNFTCTSLFYIGADANLTGTLIEGVSVEVNNLTNAKGLILLSDHPSSSATARRPMVRNISSRAIAAGSGDTLPIWINASLAEVQVEYKLLQPESSTGLQLSGPLLLGSRQTNPNGIGDTGPDLFRAVGQLMTLTPGDSAAVIPVAGIAGDGTNGGIFAGSVTVHAWGKNGSASFVCSAGRAAASTSATIATPTITLADTAGRSLSLDWSGDYLSISLSGTGSAVNYMVSVMGVFE